MAYKDTQPAADAKAKKNSIAKKMKNGSYISAKDKRFMKSIGNPKIDKKGVHF